MVNRTVRALFGLLIAIALMLIPVLAFSHEGHGTQHGVAHALIEHGVIAGFIAICIAARVMLRDIEKENG